jgi:hypothetical protein
MIPMTLSGRELSAKERNSLMLIRERLTNLLARIAMMRESIQNETQLALDEGYIRLRAETDQILKAHPEWYDVAAPWLA